MTSSQILAILSSDLYIKERRTHLEISDSLRLEIKKRRQSKVAYRLLTDEKIAKEIEDEQNQKKEENPGSGTKTDSKGVSEANLQSQLSAWQSRYLNLGIKRDFANLHIPKMPEGFTRLIVVVKEFKISELITELKKMNFWTYTNLKNLDKIKDIVQRPDGDYAIWVRDRQEADEEFKNKSADDIQREGLNTETLKERILHEWAYFEETGKHLDVKNITLCSGSRYSDGCVPEVYWGSDIGKVCVSWYYSDDRFENLRNRLAVS